MLEQLLHLIARGGVHSYQDLAHSLAISHPLLEALLEELGRFGYLRMVGSGCNGNCTACSAGACAVTGPGKLWVLTTKGAAAARRLPHA